MPLNLLTYLLNHYDMHAGTAVQIFYRNFSEKLFRDFAKFLTLVK